MTWAKFSTEFGDECADKGLSDAAYRTHSEAICWLYRLESDDCVIRRAMLRRFASTANPDQSAAELVRLGFWRLLPEGWEVVHHGDVIRQSLTAQHVKREADRERQAAKWKAAQEKAAKAQQVGGDVATDVAATSRIHNQTNKQASSNESSEDEGWNFAPIERIDSDTGEVLSMKPLATTCSECAAPVWAPQSQQRGICERCYRDHQSEKTTA